MLVFPLTACFATGSVNGTDSVGGLVGQNAGSLTDCYATGLVNGTDSVGGWWGNNEYGTLHRLVLGYRNQQSE
jgi:hypothetical protein